MNEVVARIDAFPQRYPEPNNNGKMRYLTLLRAETAGGAVGWGEAISGTEEATLAVKTVVDRGLAQLVLGRDPRDVEAIWEELRQQTYWTGTGGIVTFALSAIDMALWDLAGRLADLPVHRLMGGLRRDRVRAASSVIFDTEDIEGIGRQFADLHAAGYQVLKGGWGHNLAKAFGTDPKRDLAIVRTMREAVGPDAEIVADVVVGAGWTASHAITMARAFEPYRLYWLEDALVEDDASGWARLRAATATPLCTGEKGWTLPHYLRLLGRGSLDIVMSDPGRAEGVTGARRIIEGAANVGVSWNAHSWSSALSTAASLHLSASARNVPVMEIKPIPSPMQNELVTNPIAMQDGWITVPTSPGLGVTVDERVVQHYLFD